MCMYIHSLSLLSKILMMATAGTVLTNVVLIYWPRKNTRHAVPVKGALGKLLNRHSMLLMISASSLPPCPMMPTPTNTHFQSFSLPTLQCPGFLVSLVSREEIWSYKSYILRVLLLPIVVISKNSTVSNKVVGSSSWC